MGTKWEQSGKPRVEQEWEQSRIKNKISPEVGQECEQNGKKVGARTPKWDKNRNKVGTRTKSGTRMGTKWEESENKNPHSQEWEQSGNKNPKWDKNGEQSANKVETRTSKWDKNRNKVGTKWEQEPQSGTKNGNKVGTKWKQEPRSGTRMGTK